jgi:hypothetical protein
MNELNEIHFDKYKTKYTHEQKTEMLKNQNFVPKNTRLLYGQELKFLPPE